MEKIITKALVAFWITVQFAAVMLKACGVCNYPWTVALAPTWFPLAAIMFCILCAIILAEAAIVIRIIKDLLR